MRYSLSLLLALTLNITNAQLKIMSYNIRYDNAGDSINQWSNRKEKMNILLKKYKPDIACFQEALNNQVNDLQNFLPDFNKSGVGRDDGRTKGEYSPVFYNKNKFKRLDANTFWLSKTPNKSGSVGWDAAITRICSYVKLKENSTGKIFFVFNTHFDHLGDTAKQMSSKLILTKIKKITKGAPVILTGDFNSEPGSKAYTEIANSQNPLLSDSFVLSGSGDCTFTGFEVNGGICKRIDYIFYSHQMVSANFFIGNDNDGMFYISDHLPVITVLNWK